MNFISKITPAICIIIFIKIILISPVYSQENTLEDKKTMKNRETILENKDSGNKFRHVIRDDISTGEQLLTIGFVYAIQWGYYVTFQSETIKEHGSFKNWYSNMTKPHFDKDNYNYNLIYHTMTGTYYYLFYRSRGYSKAGSLMWSTISQLLFESPIETATEPPSFQDMYQTPVFGAVVGMTLEHLSNMLLSTDSTFAHIIGYIFNPFALFPFSSYTSSSTPIVSKSYYGYALSFRF